MTTFPATTRNQTATTRGGVVVCPVVGCRAIRMETQGKPEQHDAGTGRFMV